MNDDELKREQKILILMRMFLWIKENDKGGNWDFIADWIALKLWSECG